MVAETEKPGVKPQKPTTPKEKKVIFFHRAYRTGVQVNRVSLARSLTLIFLIDLAVIVFYADLIDLMTWVAQNILYMLGISTAIVPWPYLFQEVQVLDMVAPLPTPSYSLIVFFISCLTIIALIFFEKFPRSLAVWLGYVSLINLISSAYFILWPQFFPYVMVDFTSLYVHTELGTWVFIPIMMGLALNSLPSNLREKFFLILGTLLYSILFGIIRYAAFMVVLHKGSFLYMACLYFAFGPFFDFLFVVGFFSMYASRLAYSSKYSLEKWRWMF